MATRDAALAPGAIDSMSFFEGTYSLAPHNTKTPMTSVDVAISSHNGESWSPTNSIFRVLTYPQCAQGVFRVPCHDTQWIQHSDAQTSSSSKCLDAP